MHRARQRVRRLIGGAAVAAGLLAGPDAHAWYFPEHVVITHEGLTQLAPGLRDVIRDAVVQAQREGLRLCDAVDVPLERVARNKPLTTKMIRVDASVECVPYAALPALAGDHASGSQELRDVLAGPKGIEITSAAAYEWNRFHEALERLPNTSLERMSFVHALDVAFYFIDPGYEVRAQGTRAHFVDSGRPLEDVLRAAGTGHVDNALGQFLVHHVRSLESAARGLPADALLEHAFALHFLEDAYSAGHLSMPASSWSIGNERARRRHDFYNARGLAVGRSLNVEPCATLGLAALELSGVSPCWVTSGDGYLGLWPDTSDRHHVARAVSKVQLELAIALNPERVVSLVEWLGEREQLALGQLLEPVPWWTVPISQRQSLRASAGRTLRLVRGAASAVSGLRSASPTPALVVGGPVPPAPFDPAVLANAIQPCKPLEDVDPAFIDADDVTPCGPTRALAVGSIGLSFLRPVMVDWPEPQVDASTLHGESKEDLGWALQLLVSANGGVLFPPRAPVDFFAPAIGVSAGVSYRWGTYLPGRIDRAIVEMNIGISDALHYDSTRRAGGNPHVTLFVQELRWPVLYELLTSYRLPFDFAAAHGAGHVLFFSGARTSELITTKPVFLSIELEAASFALSRGSGAHPLYSASPELRFYVGAGNPNAAQPSFPMAWGPTVGIFLIGGYARFL